MMWALMGAYTASALRSFVCTSIDPKKKKINFKDNSSKAIALG